MVEKVGTAIKVRSHKVDGSIVELQRTASKEDFQRPGAHLTVERLLMVVLEGTKNMTGELF